MLILPESAPFVNDNNGQDSEMVFVQIAILFLKNRAFLGDMNISFIRNIV